MTKTAYLFGEIHGAEAVCQKEFEIWQDFYKRGFRHLFMELPYFYAGFLNMWIKSASDDILSELFSEKTSGNSEFDRKFFKDIKAFCPETIFHGTDIGHAFNTTGKRYLETVSPDSEEYRIAAENIEQGQKYYRTWQNSANGEYSDMEGIREKAISENFIREFDSVCCDIVGFYGDAHVFSEETGTFGIEENMCSIIKKHYGDSIAIAPEFIKNLINPLFCTEIFINGNNYIAENFGKVYTPFDKTCEYIEIFRIADPEHDFERYIKKDNFIPQALYPCIINSNDVFLINSLKDNKIVLKQIFICDGFSEEYGKITTEISLEI